MERGPPTKAAVDLTSTEGICFSTPCAKSIEGFWGPEVTNQGNDNNESL